MKKLDLLKLLLIYIGLFVIGTAAYIFSFRTFLLGNISVFFYRGIALILLWGAIVALIMTALKLLHFKRLITVRDILLLLCAFCCINVVIFTHLPTTADRSITVFMLGYIAGDESVSYTKQELETVFADKYINEYDAFGKRLQEQIVTGTIEKTSDGRYRITDKGKSLIAIYDKITDWFLIDKKLVHPDVAK
jgi:hypothetical protein